MIRTTVSSLMEALCSVCHVRPAVVCALAKKCAQCVRMGHISRKMIALTSVLRAGSEMTLPINASNVLRHAGHVTRPRCVQTAMTMTVNF